MRERLFQEAVNGIHAANHHNCHHYNADPRGGAIHNQIHGTPLINWFVSYARPITMTYADIKPVRELGQDHCFGVLIPVCWERFYSPIKRNANDVRHLEL